jgi:uncharacterized protein with PhoU and TrkA domain
MEQLRVPVDPAAPGRLGILVSRESGLIVPAVRKPDGRMVFNPPVDMEVSGGDAVIVMGEQPNPRSLETALAGKQ